MLDEFDRKLFNNADLRRPIILYETQTWTPDTTTRH